MEARIGPRLLAAGATYETLKMPYTAERTYTPDFVFPNGVIIEVKGRFTPADRTKMIAVKRAHPTADIRLVLANAHKRLTKAKNGITESQWCEKYGFGWSAEVVPHHWYQA